MRVSEWMYSGISGEFVEFTNMSQNAIDMTGWSFDDDHATAGAFDLSGFGVVQPGESVLITESPADAFRTAWGLSPSVKIIGELGVTTGHNLARNDEINLYDPNDVLIDRLTYGDQTYPGTIRTQNISGQSCRESIGQDDVAAWEHSAVGDEYGSFTASTGETGSPGSYVAPSCNPCTGPGIGTQPASQNVCSSAGVTFSVVSTGTGPLAYQWQVESAPPGSGDFTNLADGLLAGVASIAGANTATITLTDLVVGGAASFRCLVSNSCGSETNERRRSAGHLRLRRRPELRRRRGPVGPFDAIVQLRRHRRSDARAGRPGWRRRRHAHGPFDPAVGVRLRVPVTLEIAAQTCSALYR
jgi:hypothetical protein